MSLTAFSGRGAVHESDGKTDPDSLDYLVSIGCFHHTGDVQRCIDETYRVLKPGGRACIMVYNRFSCWQWVKWPATTFKALLHDAGLRREAA